MSLRRCEWRVSGSGQTTSKSAIHNTPSYGLRNFLGSSKKIPMNEISADENKCLQDEGVDCSSHRMRAFCMGFLKVLIGFPTFPMEFP